MKLMDWINSYVTHEEKKRYGHSINDSIVVVGGDADLVLQVRPHPPTHPPIAHSSSF